MNDNENLVVDTEEVETAENVEQTTEETPKTFTQEEMNDIMGKRLARQEAQIRKEYDKKYGQLEEVLKAGTGKESVEEVTDTFTKFYESKGVKINKKPEFTSKDIEVLARADADDVINAGYDDVVEEVDRLSKVDDAKLTDREKAVLKMLSEHRQNTERNMELSKIGVSEDVYNSKEFTDFAGKFATDTPITDIYDIYRKMNPQKEVRTMGSMKQGKSVGVKDYYSQEDIERLSEEDLDNPKVWEAVRRSMTGG